MGLKNLEIPDSMMFGTFVEEDEITFLQYAESLVWCGHTCNTLPSEIALKMSNRCLSSHLMAIFQVSPLSLPSLEGLNKRDDMLK